MHRGEPGKKTRGGFMKAKALASQRKLTELFSRTPSRIGSAVLGGGFAVLFGMGSVGMMGCGAQQQDAAGEITGSTSEALVATISGTVADTAGRPLNGVLVMLSGRTMVSQTTGTNGRYSFPINIPQTTGSWAVQPSRGGCTFNPTVANLNNINGSRTANFTGSGTTCVGVTRPRRSTRPIPGRAVSRPAPAIRCRA